MCSTEDGGRYIASDSRPLSGLGVHFKFSCSISKPTFIDSSNSSHFILFIPYGLVPMYPNILSQHCSACISGLYGNDDLHNGLLEVLTSGRKVDNLVITVRNQTNMLESILTTKIRPQLVELADIFDQPVSNQTALSLLIVALNVVQGNVTLATNAAGDIRRPLMGISMSAFLSVSLKFDLIKGWTLTCKEETFNVENIRETHSHIDSIRYV